MDAIANTNLLTTLDAPATNNALSVDNTAENQAFDTAIGQACQSQTEAKSSQSSPAETIEATQKRQNLAVTTDTKAKNLDSSAVDEAGTEMPSLSADTLTQLIENTRQPIFYQPNAEMVSDEENETAILNEAMSILQLSDLGKELNTNKHATNLTLSQEQEETKEDSEENDPLTMNVASSSLTSTLAQEVNAATSAETDIQPKKQAFNLFSHRLLENTQTQQSIAESTSTETAEDESADQDLTETLQGAASVGLGADSSTAEKLAQNIMNVPGLDIQIAKQNELRLNEPALSKTDLPAIPLNREFSENISARTVWFVKGEIQQADIQLDPPELGPIQIKIALNRDEASITFQTHSPEARDALNDSLTRLKEMMMEQGFQSVNVDISDGRTSRDSQNTDMIRRANNNLSADAETGTVESLPNPRKKQGLDLFA